MELQVEVTGDLDSDADDVGQRRPTSQVDPGTFDMRGTPTWRCCGSHLWVQGTRTSVGRRVGHCPTAALLTSRYSSTETTLAPTVNVGVLVPRPRVFRSHSPSSPSRFANAARSTRWRAAVATAANCCQWAVIAPPIDRLSVSATPHFVSPPSEIIRHNATEGGLLDGTCRSN